MPTINFVDGTHYDFTPFKKMDIPGEPSIIDTSLIANVPVFFKTRQDDKDPTYSFSYLHVNRGLQDALFACNARLTRPNGGEPDEAELKYLNAAEDKKKAKDYAPIPGGKNERIIGVALTADSISIPGFRAGTYLPIQLHHISPDDPFLLRGYSVSGVRLFVDLDNLTGDIVFDKAWTPISIRTKIKPANLV